MSRILPELTEVAKYAMRHCFRQNPAADGNRSCRRKFHRARSLGTGPFTVARQTAADSSISFKQRSRDCAVNGHTEHVLTAAPLPPDIFSPRADQLRLGPGPVRLDDAPARCGLAVHLRAVPQLDAPGAPACALVVKGQHSHVSRQLHLGIEELDIQLLLGRLRTL